MFKAQSDTGKVHVVKPGRHLGMKTLLCTGRSVDGMVRVANTEPLTCKSCARKVAEMGGIPEEGAA